MAANRDGMRNVHSEGLRKALMRTFFATGEIITSDSTRLVRMTLAILERGGIC